MADQRRTTDGDIATSDVNVDPRDAKARAEREKEKEIKEVRASDIEPYTGLRYLSKLFRFMSVILLVLLAAEVVTGLYSQGSAALPTLLGEASRLIVLAGVLWGTGDLAHLLIDIGHDVRASRIMVARATHARSSSASRTSGGEFGTVERTITPRPNLADRMNESDEPPIP